MIAIINGVGRRKNEMGKILVDIVIFIPNSGGKKSRVRSNYLLVICFVWLNFTAVMQASDLQTFS
jgi:hypothetical protein